MYNSVKLELIDPAKARDALATSPRNRPISDRRVKKYADDMKNGNWSPASMIIFNEDGELVDGHHRLEAVVMADKEVVMTVFYGLAKRCIPFIDTGRPRTAGDMLAFIENLDNEGNLRNKSSLVKSILAIKGGDILRLVGFDEIANFLLDNTSNINAAYNLYKIAKNAGGSIGTGVAAYFIIEKGCYLPALEKFFKTVASGEDIHKGMPEYALRNALFSSQRGSGGTRRHARDIFYTLTAWKDKATETPRRILRMPQELKTEDLLNIL